jgi:hypothetical protein
VAVTVFYYQIMDKVQLEHIQEQSALYGDIEKVEDIV